MSITYERDDSRRLITVTVTEPYTVDEILGAIDRQAAEHTWGYALLYQLSAVTRMPTEGDARQCADRIKAVGGGRACGPAGLMVGPQPEQYRWGLMYTALTRTLENCDVLVTAAQLVEWLARHAPRRTS